MLNKVLGAWRPQTMKATIGGKVNEPFGPKPKGLLCFHEGLHFVELMSDPSVPKFRSDAREGGTAEEDKAAMVGNLALFGTYEVDGDGNFTGNTVEGCAFPNWIGDKRTSGRLQEDVEGDTMTEIFRSGDVRIDIVWKRVQQA